MKIIEDLQKMIESKDKKIAELEKAVAEGGGVHNHYHTHYDQNPYYRYNYPYSQQWGTFIANGTSSQNYQQLCGSNQMGAQGVQLSGLATNATVGAL